MYRECDDQSQEQKIIDFICCMLFKKAHLFINLCNYMCSEKRENKIDEVV